MSATIFFASDHHFSHALLANARGFKSVEEMDELMVERHNKTVRPQDHIYFLGDVAMRREKIEIVRRMNGHKRLIFGNHDIFDYGVYVKVGFKKLMAYRVFDKLIFSHVPLYEGAVARFTHNIHGHTHSRDVTFDASDKYDREPKFVPDKRYFNVCVERINFTPISLEEIRSKLKP